MNKNSRDVYIDHLRIFLTIMVVLVHTAVTYGSEGGWYFSEPTENMGVILPLTLFSAVNQSFFMSLFFFLAAFYNTKGLSRKSTGQFALDRVKRLLIPLLGFIFLLGPLSIYLADTLFYQEEFNYLRSLHNGPMWFVFALLIFTGTQILVHLLNRKNGGEKRESPHLDGPGLIIITLLMSVLTIAARAAWPIGEGIWGLQLGSFPQYIMMYILGITTSKGDWLEKLDSVPLRGFLFAAITLILSLPLILFLGIDPELGLEPFMGGLSWQAAAYGTWESIMCIVMSVAMLALFKKYLNKKTIVSSELASSAYTVYIIHPHYSYFYNSSSK